VPFLLRIYNSLRNAPNATKEIIMHLGLFAFVVSMIASDSSVAELGSSIESESKNNVASDNDVDLVKGRAAKPSESLVPYTYQSATTLNAGYSIVYGSNPGQVIRYGGRSMAAEIKVANETDPSIRLYMTSGPLRFYVPSGDITTLRQPNWQYKDCNYRIVDRTTSFGDVGPLSKNLRDEKLWRFLVESECNDTPRTVVRYLFDVNAGLLSFTIGNRSNSESDELMFQPIESYFFVTGRYGFGASHRD